MTLICLTYIKETLNGRTENLISEVYSENKIDWIYFMNKLRSNKTIHSKPMFHCKTANEKYSIRRELDCQPEKNLIGLEVDSKILLLDIDAALNDRFE